MSSASSPESDIRCSIIGWRPLLIIELAALGQFGPDVVVARARIRPAPCRGLVRRAHGDLGDAVGVAADFGADLAVEIGFEFDDSFAGVGDQRFMLFQLQRKKAFGVRQCLLAYVIAGREFQVRFRDLDVITEDLVVADLERLDSVRSRSRASNSARKSFPPANTPRNSSSSWEKPARMTAPRSISLRRTIL